VFGAGLIFFASTGVMSKNAGISAASPCCLCREIGPRAPLRQACCVASGPRRHYALRHRLDRAKQEASPGPRVRSRREGGAHHRHQELQR
jgi:hypothetical protein